MEKKSVNTIGCKLMDTDRHKIIIEVMQGCSFHVFHNKPRS